MKEVKVFDVLKLLGFSGITNDGASRNGEWFEYGAGLFSRVNKKVTEDMVLVVLRGASTPVIRLRPVSAELRVSNNRELTDIYHISMGTNEMSLEEKIIFMKLLGD